MNTIEWYLENLPDRLKFKFTIVRGKSSHSGIFDGRLVIRKWGERWSAEYAESHYGDEESAICYIESTLLKALSNLYEGLKEISEGYDEFERVT